MLSRLKTLPLTIVLTVLIWMYAEAQFTSTQDGVKLSVKINSPSPDLTLRLVDTQGVPSGGIANMTITIEGPKDHLDRIYRQSLTQGAAGLPDDEEFSSLSYSPALKGLPQGDSGNSQTVIDTVAMLNSLPYFKNRSVIVTSAVPSKLHVEVDTLEHVTRPVEFRPSVALERFTLAPDSVTVNIPSRMLQQVPAEKFTVTAIPQGGPGRDLAFLPPETDQTLPVRYSVDYPATRDERVTVTPAAGNVTVRLPKRPAITETINDLPVWVSGPPDAVARYQVELYPRFLKSIVVSGSPAAIQALRQRMATSAGGTPDPTASRVHAYLDITADDRPSPNRLTRALRYTLPEGLSLQQYPTDIDFRLLEPAGAGATTSQPATNK